MLGILIFSCLRSWDTQLFIDSIIKNFLLFTHLEQLLSFLTYTAKKKAPLYAIKITPRGKCSIQIN